MGMSPPVSQVSPSTVPLAAPPTVISIQDTTLDPLVQKVKAVKIEAYAAVDALLLSLLTLENATATSVIAVAKALKEFKPVSVFKKKKKKKLVFCVPHKTYIYSK